MKKSVKEEGKGIMKKNISFKGCDTTLEQLFGKKKIARPDLLRVISAYIRENELAN